MQEAGYYSNVKQYGQGSSQVFTHAEGNALMKVHSQYGAKLGDSVTIYVDRATCGICQNNLPILKEYMGIKNLTVINKNGKIFNF